MRKGGGQRAAGRGPHRSLLERRGALCPRCDAALGAAVEEEDDDHTCRWAPYWILMMASLARRHFNPPTCGGVLRARAIARRRVHLARHDDDDDEFDDEATCGARWP